MADDPRYPFDYNKYRAEQERDTKEYRERASPYLANHPDLPERQRLLIEGGSIEPGLTKEQINIMIGSIIYEKKPTTEYGADEVWIYKLRFKHYLYFKNDILIKEKRTLQTIFGEEEL